MKELRDWERLFPFFCGKVKEGLNEREIMALLLFPVSVSLLPVAVEEKGVGAQPCADAVTGLGQFECSQESSAPRSRFWHSHAASQGTHAYALPKQLSKQSISL